jgi:hypothetical protein
MKHPSQFLLRLILTATGIFTLLVVSGIMQPQTREVDFNILINDRLDKLISLVKEEIPSSPDQLVEFLEAARTGVGSGQTQPAKQSLGIVAGVLLTLSELGSLSPLQVERIRLATTLVADAVLLAFPEENLTISVGLYANADGKERVVGPFLGDCVLRFTVALPGAGDFNLKACVNALPTKSE